MIQKLIVRFSSVMKADLLSQALHRMEFDVRIYDTLHEALQAARRTKPCILLLDDAEFDNLSNRQLAFIRESKSDIRCLVIAAQLTDTFVDRVAKSTVSGVVMEKSGFDTLCLALSTIRSGSRYFDELTVFEPRLPTEFFQHSLSNRESQIYELVRQNSSSKTISQLLGISLRTVETIRLNIRRKLQLVRSRGKENA